MENSTILLVILFVYFLISLFIMFEIKKYYTFLIRKLNSDFNSQLSFYKDEQTSFKNQIDEFVSQISLMKNNAHAHALDLEKIKTTSANLLVKEQEQTLLLKEQIEALKINLLESKSLIEQNEINHASEINKTIQDTRKETLKKSRAVLRGQASEHLAPFVLKDTNPKDYRFMGNPVDYVCFDGLSNVLDGVTDQVSSVRFIDIKTGKSTLNKSQRRIRDAIKENRVTFEVINLDDKLSEGK